jgi:hypothetical protein
MNRRESTLTMLEEMWTGELGDVWRERRGAKDVGCSARLLFVALCEFAR